MLIKKLSEEIFAGNIPAFLKYVCSGAMEPFPSIVPGENPPVLASLYLYAEKLYPGCVPDEILSAPALNGIARKISKDNLRLAGALCQLSDFLRARGIECMPIKGGAVKVLLPDVPRFMSDIDLLVREENFRRSIRTASEMGYTYKMDVHSADIFGDDKSVNLLDIHRFVMMGTGRERKLNEDFFRRSYTYNAFGSDVLMPCAEDLLFILMVNDARNIADNKNDASIATSVMDIHYLIRSKNTDFNWDIVRSNAVKSGSMAHLRFVSELIGCVAPGMIPVFDDLCSDKEYAEYLSKLQFKRYCLEPLQIRSHQLTVRSVLEHPCLVFSFISVRPRYTFLKAMRNNTGFVCNYLKKHNI